MAAVAGRKRKEVEDPNNTWNMQLAAAVLKHEVDVAASLIEKGADINHYAPDPQQNHFLLTPLHLVILRGGCHQPTLEWLVSKGASNELFVNKTQGTIFHYLAATEQLELLEKLCAIASKQRQEHTPLGEALDFDAIDSNRLSPCMWAIHQNRSDIARIFLSHGCQAPFSTLVTAKYTALARACVMGEVAVVETLLSSGDIPTQLSNGQTLLHLSLRQPVIMDLLLERGVSIHTPNADGESPFLYVVKHKPTNFELQDALIAKGADVNLGDTLLGLTPLMHAVHGHCPELVKRLLNPPVVSDNAKVEINARDAFGGTVLHWAVTARQKGVLEMLLAVEGIDINAADANGATALMRAASRGKLEVLQHLLLQPNIDVNLADKHGNTALHLAVLGRESACVAALLKRCADDFLVANGVTTANAKDAKKPAAKKGQAAVSDAPPGINPKLDVDAVNAEGRTSLQLAITVLRDTSMAAMLLQAGASVDRAGERGGTLLHSAVWGESIEMTETLLNNGANAVQRDDEDEAPLHIAARKGNVAIAKLLIEHDAQIDDQSSAHLRAPLHYACENGDAAMMTLLLNSRATPSVTDRLARTPLHLACLFAAKPFENESEANFVARRVATIDACLLLLEHDAPIDATDTDGWLPIHAACAADLSDVVAKLAEAGSPLTHADNRGWTPLHVAAAHGATAAFKTLLDAMENRGVAVQQELARVDKWDRFPMLLAAECGSKDIARLLIARRKM